MYKSLKIGTLSGIEESRTIADGLSVRKPGDITFSFVKRYVDDIVPVSDEEIIGATTQLLKKEHVLAEPSGAAALAGLLKVRRETGKKEDSAYRLGCEHFERNALKDCSMKVFPLRGFESYFQ